MIAVVRITGVAVNIIRNVAAEIHCWIDILFSPNRQYTKCNWQVKREEKHFFKKLCFSFRIVCYFD